MQLKMTGSAGSKRSIEISLDAFGLIVFVVGVGALLYRYGKLDRQGGDEDNEDESETKTRSRIVEPSANSGTLIKRSNSIKSMARSRSRSNITGSISNVKRDKAKTFMEQQKEHAEELMRANKEEKVDTLKGRVMEGVSINEVRIHDIPSLKHNFTSVEKANTSRTNNKMKYHKVLATDDYVLRDIVRKNDKDKGDRAMSEAFLRAGPRSHTHFDPSNVTAAIVTCGGLCPGLNNVIRELTHSLYHLYGAKRVIGIRGGYHGFSKDSGAGFEPVDLTTDNVEDIHHEGGTILASSRGGFDIEVIMDFIVENSVNQLYVIGGDGTHRGANHISETCIQRNLNVAVVGIPKTIDNDVDLIDRSFGFTTSVEHAQAAIKSAKTEARCNLPNGIGIVKLMGRSAGFIAAHSTLASGDVDLCLVPEIAMDLEGKNGCLPFLLDRVKENGHAVVVVAEGAGEEVLGESTEKDASGNKKLPAIGEFLKKEVVKYFKAHGLDATVKYIDPSYMIRSVPANASDSLYCMLLAQNAVHGCMAGYTAFSVGLVNNRVVYIPILRLVATSPRVMDPKGRTWERVLSMTRQPNTKPAMEFSSTNDRTTC